MHTKAVLVILNLVHGSDVPDRDDHHVDHTCLIQVQTRVQSRQREQGSTDDVLYPFVHIPKTAGQSFWQCIQDQMEARGLSSSWKRVFPNSGHSFAAPGCGSSKDPAMKRMAQWTAVTNVGQFNEAAWWNDLKEHAGVHCSASELQSCISSGFSENVSQDPSRQSWMTQWVSGHPWNRQAPQTKYITILRHPLPRVLSEYYYCAKTVNLGGSEHVLWAWSAWWPQELFLASFSLQTWISSPYNNAHNRMTKQLGAKVQIYPQGNCLNINYTSYSRYWAQRYGFDGWSPKLESVINKDTALLESVKQDDQALHVGVLEDMGGSVARLLEKVMGLKSHSMSSVRCQDPKAMPEDKVHASDRPETSAIKKELIDEILARNQLDLELWKHFAKANNDLVSPSYKLRPFLNF